MFSRDVKYQPVTIWYISIVIVSKSCENCKKCGTYVSMKTHISYKNSELFENLWYIFISYVIAYSMEMHHLSYESDIHSIYMRFCVFTY